MRFLLDNNVLVGLAFSLDLFAPPVAQWDAPAMPSERRLPVWSGIAKVPAMSTGQWMSICGI